jgi:ABC-2 type transport system permease protein
MGIINDAYTLYYREMLIFKKNIAMNTVRSVTFPLLFVLLLGSFGSSPKNVPAVVVNYAPGPASLRFINALQSGSSVIIVSQTNQQEAMSMLSDGSVAGVVVIPSGFSTSYGSHSQIQVYLDNSQPQSAAVLNEQVNAAASEFGASALNEPPISVVTNYAYGASSNYISFVVGGILVMVASFGAIFSAGFTMIGDRQLGNLKAFLTTPINNFSVLLSKIAYGTFQSAFSAYVGLAIGLLYGATIAAGLVGFVELLWIILLVGLGFGALAIALATRARDQQTYALIGQTLALPLSFLGGAFVPVTLLPKVLLPVVEMDPLTYAVNAVRDIMIKGFLPLPTLISTSAILLFFALMMSALAFMLFRDTSKQI